MRAVYEPEEEDDGVQISKERQIKVCRAVYILLKEEF
jgi:hypothetical protein